MELESYDGGEKIHSLLHEARWVSTVPIMNSSGAKEDYCLYDLRNHEFNIKEELNWKSIEEPLYSINSANFLSCSKKVQYVISGGKFKIQILVHNGLLG